MLKTLFTPFVPPSTHKQTAAMMVTSHDINFVMGFIKEEEMFSSPNASLTTLPPTTMPITNVSKMMKYTQSAEWTKKEKKLHQIKQIYNQIS